MNKFTMLTAAALIGTAGMVAALDTTATENAFGLVTVQDDNMLIELPLVTATADGMVEIRPIVDDRMDEVLGSTVVTAGANENVQVTLTQQPLANSVMAVLVIDGADVAMQEIELSSPGD